MITLWRDKQILPESMFQPKDSGFGSRRQVIIYLYRDIHTQLAIIPLIEQAYKNAFYEDMNAIFAMLFFAMYHLWQEKETTQWYLEDNWVLLVWVSGLCILERLREICQNFPKNRELFGDVKMLKTLPDAQMYGVFHLPAFPHSNYPHVMNIHHTLEGLGLEIHYDRRNHPLFHTILRPPGPVSKNWCFTSHVD